MLVQGYGLVQGCGLGQGCGLYQGRGLGQGCGLDQGERSLRQGGCSLRRLTPARPLRTMYTRCLLSICYGYLFND